MIAIYFSLGVIFGFLAYGFIVKLPHEDLIELHLKTKRIYELSYQKWMYYIANGVNNVSDKNTGYLLEDLGIITKLLANLVGVKDATLNYYVGEVNDDEH